MTGFSVNKEEGIFYAADGGSCSVADVIMEDVTKVVWSCYWSCFCFLFYGRWGSEVCCVGAGSCDNGCGDVRRRCDGELVKGIDLLSWGLVVVVVLSLLGEGDVVEESIYSSVLCVYDGEE